MAAESEDKGWTFDAFDAGTQQLAGKKELMNYQMFIAEHSKQLKGIEDLLDETLGDAWDFTLDPIALQNSHSEHATLLELIKTDHKILNKVVTVFAALCSEIDEHTTKAKTKFYLPLLMYGEGGDPEKGLQEGEAQLMMGHMLKVLQDLMQFINRINDLVKNMVWQLASLYGTERDMAYKVMDASGIHLQTVFEHIGDALAILITLDHIFMNSPMLKEHWNQYKRIITSIKGNPGEYGVDEVKLKPFEKLLQTMEGKLMEGHIFRTCVTQIFETREVVVAQNQLLMDEFLLNIRNILTFLESRIGESNEMGQRQKLIGLCGLVVLHYQICNYTDKKLAKQIWDIHKKIPAVHILGYVVWFHTDFLLHHLPYVRKVIDKKQMALPDQMRKNFLDDKAKNLTKTGQQFYMQVSAWMIRMEADLVTVPSRTKITKEILRKEISVRVNQILQGLLLAYSISNSVRTLLSLHQHMRQPMTKSGVLAVCRLVELLKCIQCTFHRRSMIVAEYITLIINHYELALLHQLNHTWTRLQENQQRGYSEKVLDVLAAIGLMKTVLNGPGTKERRLVAHIAYHFTRPRKDGDNVPGFMRKLDAICELRTRLQEVCDCSFLYWHRDVLVPLYFADVYHYPSEAHRLHYMFSVLRDSVPAIRHCHHHDTPDKLLDTFEKEIEGYLQDKIMQPLCLAIEEDLRLSTHFHLQLDDRNPFKVGLHDLKHFMDVKPIRFFDRFIDIKAHVTHYLDTTFYNLTTVALHDWKTYGDMRNLAFKKFGLHMLEPHLPSATLEQGLDVLEIMRHIHVFVTRYCYNLNNQIFVERTSNNKHLNTINIRHIANSIRTHGTGIMNTTVNFTYQFLRKKFFIFSQFMYDEYIKARLLKEIRFYKESKYQLDQRYPFARAEKFNKVIRKLGSSPDGLSYLDQFRILITQIGNAMGYIRMIRSGGLHCCSNAIRFVPDLEDIVSFEELVTGTCPMEAMDAARILDSVIGNLAKTFAEGTEYFKLLVDVFASVFRNPKNRHLQNFFMIVPPLTMNYVDYIMNAKDKMNKKNKQGAAFTDDGFAMGIAYILKLVDQYHAFDSLHWFESVRTKYEADRKAIMAQGGKDDSKLQATNSLSMKRLENYTREFDLLHYSLSSARIFFRADLTAEEEEEKDKKAADGDKPQGGGDQGEGGASGDGGGPPPPPPSDGGGGGAPPPPPPPPPPPLPPPLPSM